MSFTKRALEEQWERRWKSGEGWVCAQCVNEEFLAGKIKDAADEDVPCDFCEQTPAAAIDVLVEAFVAGVRSEYATVEEECIPYDSEDGQYVLTGMDTWDLIYEEFGEIFAHTELADAVFHAMDFDQWVRRHEWAGDGVQDILSNGWNSFCEALKHETRYVFMAPKSKSRQDAFDSLPPDQMLTAVGQLIDFHYLYSDIEVGQKFWRARTRSDLSSDWGAGDLGTAGIEHSKQANRMSPAGIPMFYGADDPDTAIRESLVRTADSHVTVAAFRTPQIGSLIDLTKEKLPPVPSIFEVDKAAERPGLRFLHAFVDRLSEPIRESYEQVDYVPTQVLTEYLLKIHNRDSGGADGLMYSSSITGKPCVVLAVPHDRCVGSEVEIKEDHLHLVFDPDSVETFRIERTYAKIKPFD